VSRDLSIERESALTLAVELHRTRFQRCDGPDVLRTADSFFEWLTAPLRLVITLGPEVDQTTGKPTGNPGGSPMKDTSKMQLMVQGEDAKDQPTNAGVDLQWSSADESIATVQIDPNDNTPWLVAGLPGSTVITAVWPDSPSGSISGTLAVDVTAGDAVSLTITTGPEVPQ
jgi:hypothetical protein